MRLILFVIVLSYTLVTQAAAISQHEAQELANQFLAKNKPRRAHSHNPAAINLTLSHTVSSADGSADFYVFNRTGDAGYVIVSADDGLMPVVGYADTGSFDPNQIPENMQWWLDNCQREIEYLKHNPGMSRVDGHFPTSVQPLVSTYWNQSAPYNKKCPSYILGYTSYRCATGCVATAVAQIMNYHRWPVTGTGQHSYICKINNSTKETTLSADFGQSTYAWDKMLDIYDSNSSSECCEAVSKLMSDIGIAVEMQYGMSSGAFSPEVVTALTTYFGYDKRARLRARENYSLEEWETIIRDELDNNRPVYYSGMSTTGGHAFVCDGYDTNGYFHFNWGWGGKSDGYFVLSMLNPASQGIGGTSGGYNSVQSIITGIMPEQGDSIIDNTPEISATCTLSTTAQSVELGNTVQFNVSSACLTGVPSWFSMFWGVGATGPDASDTILVDDAVSYADASYIKPGGGYSMSGLKYTPPASLPDGHYYIRLTYLIDFATRGFFRGNTPGDYIIDMQVKGGRAYFSKHVETSDLQITFADHGNVAYKDQMCILEADITNNAGEEFFDYMYVALVNSKGVVATKSDPILVGVLPGDTFHLTATLKAATTMGNYSLALLESSGHVVEAQPVVVADGGGTVNLQVVSNVVPESSEMAASDIGATAVITNVGGTFVGTVDAFVIDTNRSTILNQLRSSSLVTVNNGEEVTVSFSGHFAGVVGNTYYLALRNPNPAYASKNQVWASLVPFTVVEPYRQGDVNGDKEIDVADINSVVSFLMGCGNPSFTTRADVNHDGEIDVADINATVVLTLK